MQKCTLMCMLCSICIFVTGIHAKMYINAYALFYMYICHNCYVIQRTRLVFSEIISIGEKNWQICGKKYIGERSGGHLRPPAEQGSALGGKPPGRKGDLAFWGHFSWPLRLSDGPLSLTKKYINSSFDEPYFD